MLNPNDIEKVPAELFFKVQIVKKNCFTQENRVNRYIFGKILGREDVLLRYVNKFSVFTTHIQTISKTSVVLWKAKILA